MSYPPYAYAAAMLGCEIIDLPPELRARIDRVATLVRTTASWWQEPYKKPGLNSRQVVAMIVEQYLREQEVGQ